MIVIGIDPGTTTGFASWSTESRALVRVESLRLHRALEEVRLLQEGSREITTPHHTPLLVIFEDARTLRFRGGRNEKAGSKVLQGVGSVKRDCAIWQEFLEDMRIPYQAKVWSRGTTKWDAERFRQMTGWPGMTNEHARDAAVIVHGLNLPMAQGIVRAWEQRSTLATSPSLRVGRRSAGTRRRSSATASGA